MSLNTHLSSANESAKKTGESLSVLFAEISPNVKEEDGEYYIAECLANNLVILSVQIDNMLWLLKRKYKFPE
jgi:hypothetical protein